MVLTIAGVININVKQLINLISPFCGSQISKDQMTTEVVMMEIMLK
jgi:uncharacterized membrane protein (Fun14 family)